MRSILSFWDTMVESVAVIAIVVIALGLTFGTINRDRILPHLGAVLGALVLLITLPPILVGIWHSLSLWQQLGIATLFGLVGIVALQSLKQRSQKRNRHLS